MFDYSKIIDLDRPEHNNDLFSIKHPKMRREDRAKIFAPFAALNGHAELLASEERITVPKIEVSADDSEIINENIVTIAEKLRNKETVKAAVTYYVPDKYRANEGMYIVTVGAAEKIDETNATLKINGVMIDFDDISNIEILNL